MSDHKFRDSFYALFSNQEKGKLSLIDYLEHTSCDELIVVDFKNDSFTQLYHVDGKYAIPSIDNFSFKALFSFTLKEIVHPDDREIFKNLMDPDTLLERLDKAPIHNFLFEQFRYKLQDDTYRWVEQCLITGKENGIEDGIIRLYVFDIHYLKSREAGLKREERNFSFKDHDPLTGLLREKMFYLTSQAIIDANKDKRWCIVSIDIEHFKLFDEWYGRETGDYLIKNIGSILSPENNKLVACGGYFGQDDFGVLMENKKENIEALFEDIRSVIVGFNLSVGFMPAFGVCEIKDNLLVVYALDKASIASTKAKKDIKNRICYYSEDMNRSAGHELEVLNDFMQALNNDELVFYLQPQCRISTGKIVGAESLARWVKKDGTIIPPNDFIPVLEKYGFIIDLDKYLWEKVCIWLRNWIDAGHKPVPVSLNVSRTDIFTIDIAQHFVDLTEKYHLPHSLLKLEITESAYTETTVLIGELVKKLREEGFLVLMDDFGSGYSSLNMLSNLEIDAIKLDANFLHIKESDIEKGVRILESMVNMANKIAVPIIVEGVETQEQSDFLEELGCRYVQGYHFYKPMPVSQFENIISDEDVIDDRGFVVKLNEQFRIREFLDENIYSDSMLNNIIGAVAFYSLKDDNVDIIRFNQQFYEAVNVPDFHEKLIGIQNVMPQEDRPKLFKLLNDAKTNRLNGSTGILRFYKIDGTLTSFMMHFYYLGVSEGTDRFYGSANNVTELMDLKQKMDLVVKYSQTSMIFLKYSNGRWNFKVSAQGLTKKFGLTVEEYEKELNDNTFVNRVPEELREEAKTIRKKLLEDKANFEFKTKIQNNYGEILDIIFAFRYVNDVANNVDYLLVLRLDDMEK